MKHTLPLALFFLILVLMTSLAIPAPAMADEGENALTFTQVLNGYKVTLVFDKHVIVGENPIQIQIVDAAGMPISGADVEISLVEPEPITPSIDPNQTNDMVETPTIVPPTQGSMSGMNTMGGPNSAQPTNTPSAMTSINSMSPVGQSMSHDEMGMNEIAAGSESGMYEGQILIESDGAMLVRAHITIQDKLMEVDFPVLVAKSKSGAIILVSFFVFNASILLAAVVMKSRTSSINSSIKA